MKSIVLSLVTILLSTIAFGQTSKEKNTHKHVNIPTEVKAAFDKQFAGISPKWEKEGDNYEAEFESDNKETSAVFTKTGSLVETEVEIKTEELPKTAAEYVAKNHKGATIKDAAKITDAKGTITYEAEVKGKDLIFDGQGNFVKASN